MNLQTKSDQVLILHLLSFFMLVHSQLRAAVSRAAVLRESAGNRLNTRIRFDCSLDIRKIWFKKQAKFENEGDFLNDVNLLIYLK